MPLTVLNVAYPAAVVDADPVGGAEQIVAQLDRALVASGHRSLVIACEGSQTAGTLILTPRPPDELSVGARQQLAEAHRRAISQTLQMHTIDVVHLHGVDCVSYLPRARVPTLVTLHLPPSWYPSELFTQPHSNLSLNCVSHSQRTTCPDSPQSIVVVENGIDLDRYRPVMPRGDYALALGRICPEKGQHLALEAAHRAGIPLVIAGSVFPYPEHLAYYRFEVFPRLDAERRFVGPVQGQQKTQLLAAARCLLVPSLAAETSSLVAMEALACGTPVVALRAGALPEIVEHGRTGFVVDSVNAMAAAIHAVDSIEPMDCRRAAEQRFSAARMCDEYRRLYERLAAGDSAAGRLLAEPSVGKSGR